MVEVQSKSPPAVSQGDVVDGETVNYEYIPNTTAEKRLVRKLDLLLLPLLWWMNILAHLDRSNVANANAAGLSKDLDLSDSDYSLVVSIFFIGYTLFEVPSNLLLHRFRPSYYLCTVISLWGAVVAAMSQCRTRGHFLASRALLGCIEAGMYPGALFLLTCWYKKSEIGKRFALFATSGTVSPALGGLLAGAIIDRLDGANGWPGWRWLFLIEGVATVMFAIVFVFLLVDYPLTTTKFFSPEFFSPEERRLASERVLFDRQTNAERDAIRLTPWQSVKAVVADLRSWTFLTLYLLDSTSTSISYFIPVTLKTMGYTKVSAQYMTIPIWLSGATIMLLLSATSDRLQDRRWTTTACMSAGCICSLVCRTTTAPHVRYAMLCFYIGALYTAIAQILNWTAEAMPLPNQKRAVALAVVNSWGNLSIIWGSRLWPSSESPAYATGFTAIAVMSGVAALLAAFIPVMFRLLPREPATKAEREMKARQLDMEDERVL